MISYSFLGVAFIVDQLLLPMLHPGGMPFKLSYLFLGVWVLDFSQKKLMSEQGARRYQAFAVVALLMMAVIASSMVGELWLANRMRVDDHSETARSVLIYVLMLLSFGLGLSSYQIRLGWLLYVLYGSVAANLFIVFFGRFVPWLVLLYYDTSTGLEVLDMYRPRGLLGNPNVSMLHVNLIMLGIVLSHRLGFLEFKSIQRAVITLSLPIVTALVLATRTELLVSLILGVALLSSIAGRSGRRGAQRILVLGAVCISAAMLFFVVSFVASNNEVILAGIERVMSTREALLDISNRNSSILRPLLVWEIVYARFADSPIFGTGYNSVAVWPYNYSPLYYHNDWFRVLVTSGLAGFLAFSILVWRFARIAGPIGILPFFLPALTNTFLLAIPASLFYFFLMGVLSERKRVGRGARGAAPNPAAPVLERAVPVGALRQ